MKEKMLSTLKNFAHLDAVQGYERIGITIKEVTGVSASTAFEVPAQPGTAAGSAARPKTAAAEAGQNAAERFSAPLN